MVRRGKREGSGRGTAAAFASRIAGRSVTPAELRPRGRQVKEAFERRFGAT